VRRQDRVEGAADVAVHLPEPGAQLALVIRSNQSPPGYKLRQAQHLGCQVHFTAFAQTIQPALDFNIHRLDIFSHAFTPEDFLQHRALVVVGFLVGGEQHFANRRLEKRVRILHVQAAVGLGIDNFIVFRPADHSGILRTELDGKNGSVFGIPAPKKTLAVAHHFQGMPQDG